MIRAALLDRDDTIIRDVGYLDDPEGIEFLPGAIEALRRLADAGYALILVTNQSGVARGYFSEQRLAEIHARLVSLLAEREIVLTGIYYCPHLAEGSVAPYAVACDCRKPEPGMLLRAAREHDLDLPASVMIGDGERDVEAGRRAGCGRVILLGVDARDLAEAAAQILAT